MNRRRLSWSILAGLFLVACGESSPRGSLIGTPIIVATVAAADIDAMTASYHLQDLAATAKCDVKVVQIKRMRLFEAVSLAACETESGAKTDFRQCTLIQFQS